MKNINSILYKSSSKSISSKANSASKISLKSDPLGSTLNLSKIPLNQTLTMNLASCKTSCTNILEEEKGKSEKRRHAKEHYNDHSRKIFQDLIPLNGKFTEDYPGTSIQSDDEWKQYIKNQAWGHHACCTAKIGADGDEDAVLDGDFKVRGVEGLRVVDASVFPKIPGYFIAAPIYMISEKAAEVILADVA